MTDEKKLESQVRSPADVDVSAGETVLSKDEQHLAKLGYKQGLSTIGPPRDTIDGV